MTTTSITGRILVLPCVCVFVCRTISDYYFYNWQNTGAFMYFSHHFVTIPPPTWTNAAHRHGVLSMGTVITEWEQGYKICYE